ncbi:MAG: 50S ribosomal protein L13 [Patescibacteria group bacterium]|nr:50S ribosomal protein L13 [Patescibacteria group bacterium]
MKTYQPKKNEIKRSWHLIDLKDKVLGRASTGIARLLIGKHKSIYVPHLDCGDYVVAINTSFFKVTGDKLRKKIYNRYTGYPGGIKSLTLAELKDKDAREVIISAVKNMLPDNKLRKDRLKRLKVFLANEHPYQDKFNTN